MRNRLQIDRTQILSRCRIYSLYDGPFLWLNLEVFIHTHEVFIVVLWHAGYARSFSNSIIVRMSAWQILKGLFVGVSSWADLMSKACSLVASIITEEI